MTWLLICFIDSDRSLLLIDLVFTTVSTEKQLKSAIVPLCTEKAFLQRQQVVDSSLYSKTHQYPAQYDSYSLNSPVELTALPKPRNQVKRDA